MSGASEHPPAGLTRDGERRMLGGVCAGLAARYGYDVSLVRAVTIVLGFWGIGIVLYASLWMLLPAAGSSAATPRDVAREGMGDALALARSAAGAAGAAGGEALSALRAAGRALRRRGRPAAPTRPPAPSRSTAPAHAGPRPTPRPPEAPARAQPASAGKASPRPPRSRGFTPPSAPLPSDRPPGPPEP